MITVLSCISMLPFQPPDLPLSLPLPIPPLPSHALSSPSVLYTSRGVHSSKLLSLSCEAPPPCCSVLGTSADRKTIHEVRRCRIENFGNINTYTYLLNLQNHHYNINDITVCLPIINHNYYNKVITQLMLMLCV